MSADSRNKWFEFARNTERSKFSIKTPLFLFHRSQWGCTYLAFIRGGQHGGYRINFTWYKGTFAVFCLIPGPIWEHPRWREFEGEMEAWRQARNRAQWLATGGIQ
jgi:hypothetical protein